MMPDVTMFSPAAAGALIDGTDDRNNGPRIILLARDHGWDGQAADGQPEASDLFTLAQRMLDGDDTLTPGETDDLTMRYPVHAEEWMDEHAVPAGYCAGWTNGVFYLQTTRWWETETDTGSPDRMYL